METAAWRLLNTGLQDGATNMAIDEAILEAVAAGESPPTLRFYGWQPACVSLGYGQSWEAVDEAACQAKGWGLVRRATGGRAILHIDELTYSVCAPQEEPRVRGSILESYQRLSEALVAGLQLLGLKPARAKPDYGQLDTGGAACFDGPSNYEITAHGRKLIGSAQVRKKGIVLQHGTLPLYGDISRIIQALQLESEAARRTAKEQLQARAITLESCLGRRVSFHEAADAMRAGFAQTLHLTLNEDTLTPAEEECAAQLVAQKYGHDSWNKRR